MVTGGVTPLPSGTRRLWVAHTPDWSTWVLFRDELEARRHAMANFMDAVAVPLGVELPSWVFRQATERIDLSVPASPSSRSTR